MVAIASTAEAPLTDAFLEAIAGLGCSDRVLAGVLRMSATQLSRQKTNTDGHYLQVQRFDVLPPAERDRFMDALIEALARRRGYVLARADGQQHALAEAIRAMATAVELLGQQALPFERRKEVRHA